MLQNNIYDGHRAFMEVTQSCPLFIGDGSSMLLYRFDSSYLLLD